MVTNNRYNEIQYNGGRYNIQDLILFLVESIGSADTESVSAIRGFVEAIILLDATQKEVVGKIISEDLRLNDWLEIKNSPQSDPWGG